MTPAFERDGIRLYVGDCREVVPALPEPVSAVVTDPPYGLGFMGKDWDHEVPGEAFWRVFKDAMQPGAHLLSFGGTRTFHRIAVAIEDSGLEIKDTLMWLHGQGFPKHKSLLKPAYEPIIMARKPGPGVLNIDACRIESGPDYHDLKVIQGGHHRHDVGLAEKTRHAEFKPAAGRWPANVILDEHAAALLDEQSGERKSGKMMPTHTNASREVYGQNAAGGYTTMETYGDTGGASRFFYCAKSSRRERTANGTVPNGHVTVKPLALMRWLLTLVTPPGGIVVDPFAGSGSTIVACAQLGIPAYGIDMNEEYIEIAARRIDHALDDRAREEAKPRQLSIAD